MPDRPTFFICQNTSRHRTQASYPIQPDTTSPAGVGYEIECSAVKLEVESHQSQLLVRYVTKLNDYTIAERAATAERDFRCPKAGRHHPDVGVARYLG